MKFECTINGARLDCVVTSNRDIAHPVFCTSGMTRMTVVEGGEMLTQTGSYIEVRLPDLQAGKACAFSLGYDGFKPANRAWMPLGPYLRTNDATVIQLPPVPSGFHPAPDTPAKAFSGLKLIPQPTSWSPTGQTVLVSSYSCENDAMRSVAALAQRPTARRAGRTAWSTVFTGISQMTRRSVCKSRACPSCGNRPKCAAKAI